MASVNGTDIPLVPMVTNLTSLGTNSSGTFVVRTTQVSGGIYSGVLRVIYSAIPSSSLKWGLMFTTNKSAQYKMNLSWWNMTDSFTLSDPAKSFQMSFGGTNFTLSWRDVPSAFTTTSIVQFGQLSLSIALGFVYAGSNVSVDPTISSNVSGTGTAYSFQRHVFYEPTAGNYWVFYDKSGYVDYRYSHDGTSWSSEYTVPQTGPGDHYTAVYNIGRSLILAIGFEWIGSAANNSQVGDGVVKYTTATVSGNTISWSGTWYPSRLQPIIYCSSRQSTCGYDIGMKNVNVALGVSGTQGLVALAYTLRDVHESRHCVPGDTPGDYWIGNVTNFLEYRNLIITLGHAGAYCFNDEATALYVTSATGDPVIVPTDYNGGIRVIYDNGGGVSSLWTDGNSQGTPESVGAGSLSSAAADASFNTHAVLVHNGKAYYSYRAATGSSWTTTSQIFPVKVTNPSLTVDYSTNDVYAMALNGSAILMKRKALSEQWSDHSFTVPMAGLVNASYLGSNILSASGTNSSNIALIWTQGPGSGPYSAMFAAIPLQTAWSPYSYPADPWDGNGIVPYGQYFTSLGESVSPSSGMLTVAQTDLQLAGRGLDLSLTRVYTEPYSFPIGAVSNYESYPWAPLGYGWQLNFPWFLNVSQPTEIHLSSGEAFAVPSKFWSSTTSTFENHQGEDFRLVHNSTGVFLYSRA
ncbi:hypothetical protein J2P12_07130, partial [Candidatus Bathyarchaeota archaeon]|nr:hypothetical protein [Candidatus Bathyarchaeota archaeon]